MENPAMPEKFLVGGDEGVRPLLWSKDRGGGETHKVLKSNCPHLRFSSEACKALCGPVMLRDTLTCPAGCFHFNRTRRESADT